MKEKPVAFCPRCDEKLVSTKLKCENCDMELTGRFQLSRFDYLSPDDLKFLESFLRHQGNLKALQIESGLSYPAVKKRLNEVLTNLNLIEEEEQNFSEEVTLVRVDILETDSKTVVAIKEKLNESTGKETITLYSGKSCDIRFREDEKGLVSSKIPWDNQLIWEAFDAAVEVARMNGGKASKGNAQSGGKLGGTKLPLDSVEGYIAHKVHGIQEGKTAYGPGFVICAILEWAGVVENGRGYIKLKNGF